VEEEREEEEKVVVVVVVAGREVVACDGAESVALGRDCLRSDF
jgi:hypothetical protein